MTLSTLIVVKDPVPVKPLFRFCQSLLGDPAAQRWEHKKPARFIRNPGYWNEGGQGLPAWLIVHYGADGPLDLDEDDDSEYLAHRAGCVDIDFDTAYGYRGLNGAGCSDLHAWLVVMVGQWLEKRHARYEWRQEFTGEWFDSYVYAEKLGDPVLGALKSVTREIKPTKMEDINE